MLLINELYRWHFDSRCGIQYNDGKENSARVSEAGCKESIVYIK